MAIEFNQDKFNELVLYIAQQSEGDPRFGATKLNKLLFYADFGCYRLLGAPITGATYRHLQAGPAPRQLIETRRFLIDSDAAEVVNRPYFAGTLTRIVPKRESNVNGILSDEELAIVDDVINEFWQYNAHQISERSHREWPWLVTEDMEDIPYYTAWVSTDPLTPEQVDAGRKAAAEVGLLDP
jgi:uncharacterized phage-associated protein